MVPTPAISDLLIRKDSTMYSLLCKNDYSCYSSVSNMLNHLSWPTLEQRRKYIKLVMFFKIIHGLVNISIPLTFSPFNSITRGHHSRYTLPSIRTDTKDEGNTLQL